MTCFILQKECQAYQNRTPHALLFQPEVKGSCALLGIANRLRYGFSVGPLGIAEVRITPPISRRKPSCRVVSWCLWTTKTRR